VSHRTQSGGKRSPRPLTPFARLLRWHLDNGTRPDRTPNTPGPRWSIKQFAGVIGAQYDTVCRWFSGMRNPRDLNSIEEGFFGSNPAYDPSRRELRSALQATRSRASFLSHAELIKLDDANVMRPIQPFWNKDGTIFGVASKKPRFATMGYP
jgi:hypothetical protein